MASAAAALEASAREPRKRSGNRLLFASLGLSIVGLLMVSVVFIVLYVERDDQLEPSTPTGATESGLSTSPAFPICVTPTCLQAASDIISIMDRSTHPCDDFYQFSCGNWHNSHPVQPGKLFWDAYGILQKNMDEAILDVLSRTVNDDYGSEATEKAKAYFQVCANQAAAEGASNFQLLLDHMDEIYPEWRKFPFRDDDESGGAELSRVAQALIRSRKYGIDVPVLSVSVQPSLENTSHSILRFSPPVFGTSFGPNLPAGTPQLTSEQYRLYLNELGLLLAKKIRKPFVDELADVMDTIAVEFEVSMFAIVTGLFEMWMVMATEESTEEVTMTLTNFAEVYTSKLGLDLNSLIDYITSGWDNSEAKAALTGDTFVKVASPGYYARLAEYTEEVNYNSTTNRNWFYASYVAFHIGHSYVDRLGWDFQNVTRSYQVLAGHSIQSRPELCSGLVLKEMPDALEDLYIRHHLQSGTKEQITTLADTTRDALKVTISESTWMSEPVRRTALAKADQLRIVIAGPTNNQAVDEIYEDFSVSARSFLDTTISKRTADAKLEGKRFLDARVGNPVTWSAASVKLNYEPGNAFFGFPAGMLQFPFFRSDLPAFWKFGALGTIIAHELTHGFDTLGNTHGGPRPLTNWWDEETKQNFQRSSDQLVLQYADLSGWPFGTTVQEDIADSGATKIAYKAYRSFVSSQPDSALVHGLPGLEYTADQLFFITSAQARCGSYALGGAQQWLTERGQSLARFRVVGSLQNSVQFAQSFRCPAGSYMNPNEKRGVW